MSMRKIWTTTPIVMLLAANAPAPAQPEGVTVVRTAPDAVDVNWTSKGPVDLFVTDKPDGDISTGHLVTAKDRDGHQVVTVTGPARQYFLVRDAAGGQVTRVAERSVALQQGSNFRDLGGYASGDGKRVRWGLIFRSGATPMLTADDLAVVRGLGLRTMIDLRSDEERVLAPSKVDGVEYRTVGYSMMTMMKPGTPMRNGADLYRNFPVFLAPQMRILFSALLRGEGPVAVNCSAGQDRTGFASALVLSTLGIPRETIIQDYLLSTRLRRPQFELPHIDLARFPDNPVAAMFARYQDAPGGNVAQPLIEFDGTPFIAGAFAEIESKWGSVDNYLKQEVGLTDQDLTTLRTKYLE